MASSKLLIDEPPILIQPSLAVALDDLNKAVVLQQLHYWVQRSTNVRDGRRWIYNTTKEWQEQFPFWSEGTIKRTMRDLRDQGIVVTANYNNMPMDRTLWYSIDYEKLDAIVQNHPSIRSICANGSDQIAPTNNHRLPETINGSSGDGAQAQDGKKFNPSDEEVAQVYRHYMQNMSGTMTPVIRDEVDDWLQEYGHIAVLGAIDTAVLAGKPNASYVGGILRKRAAGDERNQQAKGYNGGGRAGDKDADPDTQRANALYGERKKVVIRDLDLPDDPGF